MASLIKKGTRKIRHPYGKIKSYLNKYLKSYIRIIITGVVKSMESQLDTTEWLNWTDNNSNGSLS